MLRAETEVDHKEILHDSPPAVFATQGVNVLGMFLNIVKSPILE